MLFKHTLHFIFALAAFTGSVCRAQNGFEITIPWNDTCANGLYAQELSDGNFLVLSNNQYFYPGPGILIEGPLTYGTGLVKISETGALLWNALYPTNPVGAEGNVPANKFFIAGNKAVIPFSLYAGLMPCDSASASFSYKTAVAQASEATGALVDMYLYDKDTFCSVSTFIAFAVMNDSVVISIERAGRQRNPVSLAESFIAIKTTGDSLLSKHFFDTGYSIDNRSAFYNPADTSFTVSAFHHQAQSNKMIKVHKDGAVEELFSYTLPKWQNMHSFEKGSHSFYCIVYHVDSMNGKLVKSSVVQFSESGTLVHSIDVYSGRMVDLEMMPSGQLLALYDVSYGKEEGSIEAPVRVLKCDENLNVLGYRDFGFPFAIPAHIAPASGDAFIITGTVHKSTIDEEVREPDRIYFMKAAVDSVNLHWTTIHYPQTTQQKVNVYPNPFHNNFTAELQIEHDASVELTLFDYSGRNILMQTCTHANGKCSVQLASDTFTSGLYLLMVRSATQVQWVKVVKH